MARIAGINIPLNKRTTRSRHDLRLRHRAVDVQQAGLSDAGSIAA